jgi:pimeloyl-ACP methyl ester carboxylesterase
VPPDIRKLTVRNGDVALAGSLWLPSEPVAIVLMHPGSGPSDRENDVFFPPIRESLLGAGVAVASFDKRGVGGSTGHWQDAAIVEQAGDAVACLEAVRTEAPDAGPVGLFGHSQGGWVVVEAASRCQDAAFVVSSSGPGVTPEAQERYAARHHMRRAGIPEDQVEEVDRYYSEVVSMLRSGIALADAKTRVAERGVPTAFETLSLPVLPDDEAEWRLLAAMIDYDPRPALERIRVPVLALFGAEDPITPVERSVAVFRAAVRPELLHVGVFEGAGHRLETDALGLAAGYLETLRGFVLAAAA